jgi:hypothetical protein
MTAIALADLETNGPSGGRAGVHRQPVRPSSRPATVDRPLPPLDGYTDGVEIGSARWWLAGERRGAAVRSAWRVPWTC